MKAFLGGLLFILLIAAVGAAWYFSNLILDGAEIKGDDGEYSNEVLAITGDSITYRVPETIADPATDANTVSRVGMRFESGGYLRLDQGASVDGREVTRPFTLMEGSAPVVGALGQMDWPSYPDAAALGYPTRDVTYGSPLGAMPAVIVEPPGGGNDTWAIALHGRNGSNREPLRITPLLAERGITTMLINYRDDKKEPGAPYEDGYGNFGATEWPDAEAAVAYALQQGAADVLLVGYSMGGAVTAAYLENGSNTDAVIGTILVSPAVSFHEITVFGAELLGYPTGAMAPIIWLAERFTELRSDIDYSAAEYLDNAETWPVPALVTAGTEDDLVPPEAIEEFAQAIPDGTFELFDGAFHTGEWNYDVERFDALVAQWLDELDQGQ